MDDGASTSEVTVICSNKHRLLEILMRSAPFSSKVPYAKIRNFPDVQARIGM